MATCQVIPFVEVNFTDGIFSALRTAGLDWFDHPMADAEARWAVAKLDHRGQYEAVAIIKRAGGGAGLQELVISSFLISEPGSWEQTADLILSGILSKAVKERFVRVSVPTEVVASERAGYFERRGFSSPRWSPTREYALSLDERSRSYAAINRLAYDVLADEYEERSHSPGASQERPERFAELLTSRLRAKPRRILELGPGTGDVLSALSNLAEEVVGVELSVRMGRLASQRAPGALIICADISDIEFTDKSFDAIFAGAFLHLFPTNEAEALVRRIVGWLRPGGSAFVNTSVAPGVTEGFEPKTDYTEEVVRYRARWTEDAFRQMLERNGLEIVERITTNEIERQKYWVGYLCEPVARGSE